MNIPAIFLLIFSQTAYIPLPLGKDTLYLELAVTKAQQERGLMYRDTLPENRGMLFIFDRADTQYFWMKNTLIPLAIAFLDSNGVVLNIEAGVPLSEKTIKSRGKSTYVIETNAGYFKNHHIKMGDTLLIPEALGLR